MAGLSGWTRKLLPIIISFIILLSITFPLTTTSSADDGTGVGVEPVDPRITNIEIKRDLGEYNFQFDIFDLNGWAHVSKVEIGLLREGETIDHYVYNQTYPDFEDEFWVEKGESPIDQEVNKEDNGDSVEERCTLTLFFQFRDRGYDEVRIRAVDDDGGSAVSYIDFPGIAAGHSYTAVFLATAGAGAIGLAYKAYKDSGGAIGG